MLGVGRHTWVGSGTSALITVCDNFEEALRDEELSSEPATGGYMGCIFPLLLKVQSTEIQMSMKDPGTKPSLWMTLPSGTAGGSLTPSHPWLTQFCHLMLDGNRNHSLRGSANEEKHTPSKQREMVTCTFSVVAVLSQNAHLPHMHTHAFMGVGQESNKNTCTCNCPAQSFHTSLFTPPVLPTFVRI